MTPSRRQNDEIGGFDFHEVGRRLADLAVNLGQLEPHDRILDVGCGYGRLAVALTRHLADGEYAGFDVDRRAIRWCQKNVSAVHPNFWFTHANVANNHYNRDGHIPAAEFRFPCAPASVDVVFASSVFTHLLPAAADHYVAESARVLKPGGRLVASFFLLDETIRPRLSDPLVQPRFRAFPTSYSAVADAADPEAAIAYDATVVTDACAARGLEVLHIEHGSWRAVDNVRTYQDVVVATKR